MRETFTTGRRGAVRPSPAAPSGPCAGVGAAPTLTQYARGGIPAALQGGPLPRPSANPGGRERDGGPVAQLPVLLLPLPPGLGERGWGLGGGGLAVRSEG